MAIQKQGAGVKKNAPEPPASEPEQPVPPIAQDADPGFFGKYEELIAQGEIAPVFGQPNPGRPEMFPRESDDLAQLVQDAVAKLLAAGVVNLPSQPVAPKAPEVPNYKKHFRNDLRPDEIIQRLDMSALDRGERPQANPIPGSYIKFRLGHLYTNDDNDIRQIEWMISRPATDSEGNTIGGAPHIYEDDGSVLLHCAVHEKTFASKAAYDAHMRSVHGVGVN